MGESVILFGPVVGKTHIAQALGHLVGRQGAHVRFTKTSRVLVLDDFAMRQLNATQADDLYELVSARQGRSLIITSNRAPSDWHPLFPALLPGVGCVHGGDWSGEAVTSSPRRPARPCRGSPRPARIGCARFPGAGLRYRPW